MMPSGCAAQQLSDTQNLCNFSLFTGGACEPEHFYPLPAILLPSTYSQLPSEVNSMSLTNDSQDYIFGVASGDMRPFGAEDIRAFVGDTSSQYFTATNPHAVPTGGRTGKIPIFVGLLHTTTSPDMDPAATCYLSTMGKMNQPDAPMGLSGLEWAWTNDKPVFKDCVPLASATSTDLCVITGPAAADA